ncbi:MAG: archease [Thermoplasmatales archaeon]
MPISVLEHPSDIRLRARGHSFQSALLELMNYVLELIYGKVVRFDFVHTSTIEFEDVTDLVPKAINEALFISESSDTAGRIKRISLCDHRALIEYVGEKISSKKDYGILVKAATYDRLLVSRDPPVIEVTLDI